jgi:diguanylate cyclase (GGDEF)-like protein/PAS domain S-box-containing protein
LSQLAAIVQSSDDAIVGCDLDCRIISWNAGAERLYGYTAGEMKGQPLSLVVPEGPDYPVSRTESSALVRRMESVHLTRTGSLPVSVSISPVRRKDGTLTGFSLISQNISERKSAERELLHQALHDALTGLPNRRLLRDHLEQAIADSARQECATGVFFVDIDGFKTINDTLGHAVGDQLLADVAARLKTCAGSTGTLSRAGGDEFALTANLPSRNSARGLATKIMDCLRQPFSVAGNQLSVTASVGVSLFPEDCDNADSLLRNADTAMYEAKRNGRNQVHFFDPALADSLRARMEVAGGLRLALERNEFDLHFQPLFGAAENKIVRFEALLRWQPAPGVNIPPADFIPISEETGLIVPIGKWVLREACTRAVAWQSGEYCGVGVSVNVSAVQLARPDFVSILREALDETGLPATLLELELTESIFVNNPRLTARTIGAIHALGVTMALDDFGTGYSSLSYLKNLPMDALKIDRSFLSGIESSSAAVVLVQSLVSLAHSLGMRVVVEGVETRKQFELVSAAGCDELQGYLLGRPCPQPFGAIRKNPLNMFAPGE